jgi:hypothetical protein
MKKWVYVLAILMGVMLIIPQAGHATVVEFWEVNLNSNTTLAGSTAFASYGLSFGDSTCYIVDSRLIGAGTDDRGIDANGTTNVFSVIFNDLASSVTAYWVSVGGNDVFATAYDSSNNILDTFSATGLSDITYGTTTFSESAGIAKISFHDHTAFIGVGKLDFQTVPLPPTVFLLGSGLLGLAGWRRLRKG